MIPETNILNKIGPAGVWIEKFPEGDTTTFPKTLIKRISMNPVRVKDTVIPGQFSTRINILYYDKDSRMFDNRMTDILEQMEEVLGETAQIYHVVFDGREDGYNPIIDAHVMNLEYIIKHS